ncbi:uncharacterized protein L3040_003571 [Drepanopeziza brunnea f. sp. 'multigermtubi']|uniref:uncharacterized protein n=1 Tax=Drepanopeziza brunnea f. sp. 'multigermtubi' TaxID=698441 RepID=UPI00239F1450|nr:hypothetical protein L3040_003571 [Drepanopeziza brunnea f. sp. 'multigermtubi']
MRSQSLGLAALSALAFFLTSTASAKSRTRNQRLADLKYKDFNYPPRVSAHRVKDNQVDLGYEVHEGKLENDKFLSFRNIPYAEPPTEEKGGRWGEPVCPQSVSHEVNTGAVDHKCPQTQVGWVPVAEAFLKDFANTTKLLPAKWKNEIDSPDYNQTMPAPVPGVHEDCLTLDVMVPKAVWENRNKSDATPAAVIVWIYGGGLRRFIFGWKDQYGSPEGFFDAAEANDPEDGNVIYVAMNYRLGAWGWLGGPRFKSEGGIPNLGLLDQNFAMKWVQRYIESFGGDPGQVTVMGQSAGASSILHHITAGAGSEEYAPNFQRAILQSAGFFPQPNASHDDYIYSEVLRLTGAESLAELKQLNTTILQAANAKMTYDSPYGIFNFGPTVDLDYVPDLPSKLLADPEKRHKGIGLLLGHTAYDGLLFTPPWVRTPEHLRTHAKKLYPGIPQTALAYTDAHYPIKQFQDRFPWLPIVAQRKIVNVSDFLDDIAIQCNSYYLTEAALEDQQAPVYRYVFNTLPAVHGYDTAYTYYPSPSPFGTADPTLAKFSQAAIVNFVRSGMPFPSSSSSSSSSSSAAAAVWPAYTRTHRRVMNFGAPGQAAQDFSHSVGPDVLDREKCAFWQAAPYWPVGEERFVKQENGGDGGRYAGYFKEGLKN